MKDENNGLETAENTVTPEMVDEVIKYGSEDDHPGHKPVYVVGAVVVALIVAVVIIFGLMRLPQAQPEMSAEEIAVALAEGKVRAISGLIREVDQAGKTFVIDTTTYKEGGEYRILTNNRTQFIAKKTTSLVTDSQENSGYIQELALEGSDPPPPNVNISEENSDSGIIVPGRSATVIFKKFVYLDGPDAPVAKTIFVSIID